MITLGADPEFALLLNGRRIAARSVLTGAGTRSIVGPDGGSVLAEVRPAPSPSPVGLITNIQTSLQHAVRRWPHLAYYQWAAGAYPGGYPAGGHIHFGGNWEGTSLIEMTRHHDRMRNTLNHLDFVLTEFEALWSTGELHRQWLNRRGTTTFGQPGAFRFQPHGFEYRMPASWLIHPTLAIAETTLALLTVRWSLSHPIGATLGTPYLSSLTPLHPDEEAGLKFASTIMEWSKDLLTCHADIRAAWGIAIPTGPMPPTLPEPQRGRRRQGRRRELVSTLALINNPGVCSWRGNPTDDHIPELVSRLPTEVPGWHLYGLSDAHRTVFAASTPQIDEALFVAVAHSRGGLELPPGWRLTTVRTTPADSVGIAHYYRARHNPLIAQILIEAHRIAAQS